MSLLLMAYPTFIKKAFAFVLLVTAVAAARCHHKQDWKSLESRTSERSITIGGQHRTYLLHIPQDFSKTEDKVGFVFSYHEEYKDAYYQERISGFSDPAINNKYVTVYPQAMNGTWYSGRSSGEDYSDAWATNPQDHIYTSAILDQLYSSRGLCLDSTQAYATGMGNGSSFIHHLNCRNVHNPPFQAFAGVAGIPETLDMTPERCFHTGIRPLLMIHGTKDREYTKLKVSRTLATFGSMITTCRVLTFLVQTSYRTTLPALTEHTLAATWALEGGVPNYQKPAFTNNKGYMVHHYVWSK
jgi:poly(3-hydroxybutyrate) depolymerase